MQPEKIRVVNDSLLDSDLLEVKEDENESRLYNSFLSRRRSVEAGSNDVDYSQIS